MDRDRSRLSASRTAQVLGMGRADAMAGATNDPVGRRRFLKGAAVGAAALVANAAPLPAADTQGGGTPQPGPAALPASQLAADTEPPPRGAASRIVERPG